MEFSKIIAEIDSQIARLQEARTLLAGVDASPVATRRPGRPKGSKNTPAPAVKKPVRRQLSAEGRKRIADAMKRRWADRKSGKPATKASAR